MQQLSIEQKANSNTSLLLTATFSWQQHSWSALREAQQKGLAASPSRPTSTGRQHCLSLLEGLIRARAPRAHRAREGESTVRSYHRLAAHHFSGMPLGHCSPSEPGAGLRGHKAVTVHRSVPGRREPRSSGRGGQTASEPSAIWGMGKPGSGSRMPKPMGIQHITIYRSRSKFSKLQHF